MKRILTVTALTTVLATGAYAASEAEVTAINTVAPGVDVSMMTDAQVDEAFAIAKSGDSDVEKRDKIQQIVEGSNMIDSVSPEVDAMIMEYVPDWQVAAMTDAQKVEAQAIIESGSEPADIREEVMAIVTGDAAALTEAEMQRVMFFVPDAQLTDLTAEDVNEVRAAIYSGSSDVDIRRDLEQALS
ncbi:hypothetical protein [Salipiger mucosus]|uniref:DUF2059 domain-containing protein n=1 Tax=Salipiger mucosus DSM 16094 TaxID=1123237 RepID=S9S9K9_9RHOB|nr:hypothetical protein [Salipiger mucosus]EPX86850.1 hypothetical protein Salmuc_01501 [Salipiger mucosus DSM 16094]